jgi:DNA-binding protein Fis
MAMAMAPNTQQGASSASQEGASSASQEGASSASQEGASSASQEGGSSASQEGGSSASQEGGSSASQEGASSASQEGASSASQEGGSSDIIAMGLLGLLVNYRTQYDLSISQYDSTLSSQQKALQEYDSTIDGLNKALSTLNDTLEVEDAQYISSARGYSTLYYIYEGWQRQLDSKWAYVYGEGSSPPSALSFAEPAVDSFGFAPAASSPLPLAVALTLPTATVLPPPPNELPSGPQIYPPFQGGGDTKEDYGKPQAGGYLEAGAEIESGSALSFIQIVSSGALAEKKAYDNYLVSTATWTSISLSLSTLNTESIQIQSNLIQYGIDEAQAEQDYISTIIGLSTLSSLYLAAIANENYALALCTLTFADENYTDALLTFEKADLLYSKSLPSGAAATTGGGNKNTVKKGGAASGAVLGDSALWAARSMAQQALNAAENKKTSAEQVANTMQTLAQISESDLYDVVLYGLEQTIMSKVRFIDTIETQKASTMASLNRWSSIYETALIDYNTFDKELTHYSTLYESSIIGNSTLQGRANAQYLEIQKKQSQAGAYSNIIDTFQREYDENISSMQGYSTLSSLYMAQYWSSVYGLSTLSSLYYFRNREISIWNNNVIQTHINNVTNIVKYFVYSSMFKLDSINLDGYDAQIKDTINKEEYYAYLYRNTFCRERLLSYQTNYETGIVGAINIASNATEQALATARLRNPDATVTAIPVNLSVDSVVIPFNNINAMAPFVSSFTNIYSAYNTQTSNIYNLSTVVGHNKESWSTFSFFNNKNFYSQISQADTNTLISALEQTGYNDQNIALNLPPAQYQTLANTAFRNYSQTQQNVLLAKSSWNTQQTRISTLKSDIQIEYSNFFTPEEIFSQESTISSFIKVGVRSGLIALSNAGIIFNM